MKILKCFLLYSAVSILLSTSCTDANSDSPKCSDSTCPQNVVLMIGDGMGITHVSSLILLSENATSFERFPYSGYSITRSASNKITDSAAGGTAIATGHKTKNRMVGIAADNVVIPSLITIMAEKGKKTGIVTTCSACDATPASFLAHNRERRNYEEIASDIANNEDIDLLIAGGRKYFNDRRDKGDLIEYMKRCDWTYRDSIGSITGDEDRLLLLACRKHLPIASKRGDFLPDATAKALEILNKDNENGFFLMIEGSQIDDACHVNDSAYLVDEMKDFNKTINIVLDFAEKNPNTLVIVTADHESGGLAIIDPEGKYTKTEFKFSTHSHSPALVPVFSYGPGAERFCGIMENTDIMKRVLEIVK